MLKINLLLLVFLPIFILANDPKLMCYECSRGSAKNLQLLMDYYFYDDDKSVQRALNHPHESCGNDSSILDRTYRAYCPNLCQITYLLHDPDLTVIASCQNGDLTGSIYKDQYILVTCGKDLCNNNALNQDRMEPPSSSSNTLQIFHLMFILVIITL